MEILCNSAVAVVHAEAQLPGSPRVSQVDRKKDQEALLSPPTVYVNIGEIFHKRMSRGFCH